MDTLTQNEILKEFPYWIQGLTEEFQAEKLNNVGWWTNQRILKFQDGNVTYRNLGLQTQQNAQAKYWVEIKLCIMSIEFVNNQNQNPQHYVIQFQFKESDCKKQGAKQYSNSEKIKTWKFFIKSEQDINYIKQKSELYKNYKDLFNQYLQTTKQKPEDKEKFQQRFIEQCNQCINQMNTHENKHSFGIKIQNLRFKKEEYQCFKKYKILYSIIKDLQFDKLIIMPLQIIITYQNQKYLCQLDVIGYERTEITTNEFQNDLQSIKQNINLSSQEYSNLLDQFELITFKKGNILFGLFELKKNDKNEQNKQLQVQELTENQMQYLQQIEIYDSQQLSKELHKNFNHIYQIGQLAKKTNNFDLRKICKVEMISRAAKSYFFEQGLALNNNFLNDLFQGFFQSDPSKRSEQINKYHNRIKERIKQKFNYEIDFNDRELNCVLYLNSMMYHLNFYIPLQIEKLSDQLNLNICLDYSQSQVLERYKTYEGYLQIKLSFKNQILNQQYIQNFKKENFKKENLPKEQQQKVKLYNDVKSCIRLTNFFLGVNNSIFAQISAEFGQELDSIFLFRALECVKKVNPSLTKKISEYKNYKSIQIFSRKKQDLNQTLQNQLCEEEKQKIFAKICSMNQQPLNKIILETAFYSDDELYQYSIKLQKEKNYIDALKILSCINDQSDEKILKLGFECEMEANNIVYYYFSDKLFNHYLLMNDTDEIPEQIMKRIFSQCVSRYFKTCLDTEQSEYGIIAQCYKTKMPKTKDFINEVKYLLFNQDIETLDQYICQQFEILNDCRQNNIQKNQEYFAEYIDNSNDEKFHHAAKLLSFALNK